jgi:hypothetical protein
MDIKGGRVGPLRATAASVNASRSEIATRDKLYQRRHEPVPKVGAGFSGS